MGAIIFMAVCGVLGLYINRRLTEAKASPETHTIVIIAAAAIVMVVGYLSFPD